MASWSPLTYTVGSSGLDSVPMGESHLKTQRETPTDRMPAIIKDQNPFTIKFASTYTGTATLRVGTTLSFAGCRPSVVVNSYSPATPGAPTKIDSRGLTRGAYRGFGEVYNYAIPANTLVKGSNKIVISCVSGSSGDGFLSPNVILDAIQLFQ